MGSCVLRETIRKGRPRFVPRVSLSIYLSIYTFSHFRQKPFLQNSACDATAAALEDAEQGGGI